MSGPAPTPNIPVFPSEVDYITEVNAQELKGHIGCLGRRETNGHGGCHAEAFILNSKGERPKPDFHIKGHSDFGLSFASDKDAKFHKDKCVRQDFINKKIKAESGEAKKDEKKGDEKKEEEKGEPGYVVAMRVQKNPHLIPFGDAFNARGIQLFSIHSKDLDSNGEVLDLQAAKYKWGSVFKKLADKAKNDKYGPSLKIKVDGNTLFFRKGEKGEKGINGAPDKPDKPDTPMTFEAAWKLSGEYDVFGEVYKMNLDVKGGHCWSFLAQQIIFAPKAGGTTGKMAKYLNLGDATTATPAPVATTVSAPATVVAPAVVVATSASDANEILSVTGTSVKPAFSPEATV